MDQKMENQEEKYILASFEVFRRLAQSGYNLELPACIVTRGQLATQLSWALVEQDIAPDQLTDETLVGLVESVKEAFICEITFQLLQIAHARITALAEGNPENQEPDEGSLTEQFENATRLGDVEGYWVDGGASADWFDEN